MESGSNDFTKFNSALRRGYSTQGRGCPLHRTNSRGPKLVICSYYKDVGVYMEAGVCLAWNTLKQPSEVEEEMLATLGQSYTLMELLLVKS
ncbi:hypothetical protein SAY87_018532 [Trapa incisa]|uniref:Uncharacterized protein n=1 Tax=Trapa incisa TaxID=236973 RepID=A0AAN7LAZ3_9MYRT|nr:hypothetical protein SAY87_018532 [Trapa incisa]